MEDQNKQPITGYVFSVSPLKVSKQSTGTLSLKYRILPINHELFVFHQKSEGLSRALLQMKIKTLAVLVNFKKPDNGDLLMTNVT